MAHTPLNRDRRVVLAWLGLVLSVVSVWDVHARYSDRNR